MTSRRCSFLVMLAISVSSVPLLAQARKSASKAANVQSGTFVSLDTAAGTLTLKTKTGATVSYRLGDKTQILRNKKSAQAGDFKPGEAITVRYRKSSVGPATLHDLMDKESWQWLSRLRHETTLVTIKEIGDDTLQVAEGADSAPFEYRLSEKTLWSQGGRQSAVSEFKNGQKVYVVPRSLPSGSIMAVAITDTKEGSARLKERTKSTLSGVVKSLDVQKRSITVHTAAGEDRQLPIASDCEVRSGTKDVALASVKSGAHISLHLTRGDDGEQRVSKITLKAKTTKKSDSKDEKVK